MAENHANKDDDRNRHDVERLCKIAFRLAHEPGADEAAASAERRIYRAEREREAREARLGGDRLGGVARLRAVVDGEQHVHNQFGHQNEAEAHRAYKQEHRDGENDEARRGDDYHLLAAHLIGDAPAREDEQDIGNQQDVRDERCLPGVAFQDIGGRRA